MSRGVSSALSLSTHETDVTRVQDGRQQPAISGITQRSASDAFSVAANCPGQRLEPHLLSAHWCFCGDKTWRGAQSAERRWCRRHLASMRVGFVTGATLQRSPRSTAGFVTGATRTAPDQHRPHSVEPCASWRSHHLAGHPVRCHTPSVRCEPWNTPTEPSPASGAPPTSPAAATPAANPTTAPPPAANAPT
ncbi:MAG: hypothetical protein QOJ19_3646, partial [Acidimicrobiia bacterium]|nr:hypothetical protein [Acidimicrobiia bacterium]